MLPTHPVIHVQRTQPYAVLSADDLLVSGTANTLPSPEPVGIGSLTVTLVDSSSEAALIPVPGHPLNVRFEATLTVPAVGAR
jgi:hypothetical protein